MDKALKLETKTKKEIPEINYILEKEGEFNSWEEKMEFIKLFYMQKRDQDKFKKYLENPKFDTHEGELNIDLEQEDIISLVKTIKEHQDRLDDNQVNEQRSIFGLISFDGNSIHFNKVEDNKTINKNKVHFTIEESFSLLAEYFSHADVVPAVIGASSWLMGNESVRKKIWFKKIEWFEFSPERSDELWGQFIDINGNIKEKELKYLFINNEPRYKLTKADISFKDFMMKYGSQFLGRNFILEHDFSGKQEKLLEENQHLIDNYFAKYNPKNWVDGFYNLVKDFPVWNIVLKSEQGKLLLIKLHDLEKENLDCSTYP